MKILGFDINFGSRSHKWKNLRKIHLNNNPHCAACERSNKLDVHHIKPFNLFPEEELNPENLITLCSNPCHIVFGHFMNYKKWNPEVVKDCEEYCKKLKLAKNNG